MSNRRAFENGSVWYRYQNWYAYREGSDGEPEHVPEELPILQRICKEYLAGATPRMIRDGLNREEIANRGKPWTVPAIRRILADEKNCGDVLLQKTYTVDYLTKKVKKKNGDVPMYLVKDRHIAAIPREMYDSIQAEAARHAAKKNVSDKAMTERGKYSRKFALTSLLYCGECGSAYRRCTWTSNGQKRIVWRCVSRLDHGKKYCKRSPTIDEEKIHAALLATMTRVMQDRSHLTEVLREGLEAIAIPSDGVQASLSVIQDRLEANETEFDRLIYQMGQVGASDTLEQKAKLLSAERQHLLQAQEEQQGKVTKDESISHLSDHICERFLSIPAELTEYNDRLVYQLVAAVKVVSSEKIKITFKNALEMDQAM
ncbi:recombinase family protein [Lawsonibacter faecis]|uniref:Recombinase family protein n=1 Tax=Lawsonibacter faecis TaxID=2763052 RepID=A0A8J6MDC7_9FIRM|nr:recombinase family protein [Lawsonibacter faecis]